MIHSVRLIAIAAVVLVVAAGVEQRPATAQTPPTSGGPVDPALVENLVAANRILSQHGVLDESGHVSIRHPTSPNRYLMARSLSPALVSAEDLLEFDLDSEPVDQRGRRLALERFIHGEIYKVRPDVNAVIHSHSPSVIPFSVTSVPLRPIILPAAFLWTGVPVFETRKAGVPAADMLIRNRDLGKALADSLGDKRVALLRGHGNVVVGPDVRTAVRYAMFTETNARLLITTIGLGGGPINYISAEEGAARDRDPGIPDRAWELWKSKALGKGGVP
jgi:HCOMODA/2-hydroxy-3-carboxy-muconic semialdehyde decarboxylase